MANPAELSGPKKILVISLSGIGDTLLITPLIHELRANFPQAHIDAFVFWAGSKDLLEGNPHLNGVIQKNLVKEGAVRSLKFLAGLRGRYDISLNVHTQGRIHYRIVAGVIGAKLRVGHRYENHNLLDDFCMSRTVPEDYTIHCVENNLRLLDLIGAKPKLPAHEAELFLSETELRWAAQYVAENSLHGRLLLGVHVGSGGTKNLPLKRWPLPLYIELLKQLRASHPHVLPVLFGGPEEKAAHEEIRAALGAAAVCIPQTANLRQAGALMKYCRSFLSVDTALMHLAAAMKVPRQIVIEAPTLNATNVPWQNPHRIVRNPVVNGRNLEYYRYNGKPIQGTDEELRRCMASVTVASVHKAIDEALAASNGGVA